MDPKLNCIYATGVIYHGKISCTDPVKEINIMQQNKIPNCIKYYQILDKI